jgi:hypothetical protein
MIVTARQLEELHRDGGRNGHVRLHAGTRLSPLAQDWIRKAKVQIDYADTATHQFDQSPQLRRVVWWREGDHATSKAALVSFGDSVNLEPIKSSSDVGSAVRSIATQILSHRADAGVLMLKNAGVATVQANRIPELRAIVGTTAESVDAAMSAISPNVLIFEHSDQSFDQIKNIFARFVRGGVA